MDVYKLVREDERRALKAYFSADPLELVQAVEAAPRALLWRLGTPGRRLPLGGGSAWWKVTIWKYEKKGGAVSRFLFLNLPFIYATYPLASGGQPSSASIFGLAGPGTVPMRRRRRMS